MAVFPSFPIIFSFFSLVFFSPSVAEVKGICELQSATDFIIASFVRLAGSNAELNPDAGKKKHRDSLDGREINFQLNFKRRHYDLAEGRPRTARGVRLVDGQGVPRQDTGGEALPQLARGLL
jgi:hypothetical protein